MRKAAGFTLVEVLIAVFVGLVILGAIYATVVTSQRSSANIERRVAAGQDARAALELMAIEIQMASYNPTYATGLWTSPGNCTAVGNPNHRGIQAATASSISVEADINENGSVARIGAPNINPNEIITYTYDAANQYITRETGCGGGMPFLGDRPTSGHPRTVRVINTAAVPVFRYFDASGVEILAGALPARIPDIARIDITLWVETAEIDVSSGQRKRMVYSSSVIPRNHVIGQI
jgi:prepilin-type N-terminal cleavage/methylation domain-containing protein